MTFSLCLCRRKREFFFLSCCRIVAIVPCVFLIVSLQKKERVFFSFLLSYSRHCSVCLSHCVFAEERESWFISCCRIVAIVPFDFLIVSLQKKERAGFFLAVV